MNSSELRRYDCECSKDKPYETNAPCLPCRLVEAERRAIEAEGQRAELEKELAEHTGEHQWVRLDRHLDLVGEFRTQRDEARNKLRGVREAIEYVLGYAEDHHGIAPGLMNAGWVVEKLRAALDNSPTDPVEGEAQEQVLVSFTRAEAETLVVERAGNPSGRLTYHGAAPFIHAVDKLRAALGLPPPETLEEAEAALHSTTKDPDHA